MKLFVCSFVVASCAAAACLPVSGDRILGSHLALAEPALAGLPASITAGFAPAPGASRVILSAELVRIAKANGLTLSATPADVCFELAMRPIANDDVLAAVKPLLAPSATIEIVELPKISVPVGEIHFPITSLEPGPDVRTWRGYVQYTPTRRLPIWVRVRIHESAEALVLTSDISRGSEIPPTAYQLRKVASVARAATRPEDLTGAIAKIALKAGDTIPLAALERPPAIRRGDVVRVDVRCGPAHLQLEAVAQKEGRNGDMVELLNPISGKLFRARLEGTTAVVTVGGSL